MPEENSKTNPLPIITADTKILVNLIDLIAKLHAGAKLAMIHGISKDYSMDPVTESLAILCSYVTDEILEATYGIKILNKQDATKEVDAWMTDLIGRVRIRTDTFLDQMAAKAEKEKEKDNNCTCAVCTLERKVASGQKLSDEDVANLLRDMLTGKIGVKAVNLGRD